MENLQLPLMWLMLAVFVASLILYGFSFWARNDKMREIGSLVAIVGLLLTAVLLVVRMILIKGLPLNNGYEFGLTFVFALMAGYVFAEKRYELNGLGIFILPVAIGVVCWLINMNLTISPVMPALRSNWLVVHVSSATISYGAFALSCATSIAYLCKQRAMNRGANRMNELLPKLEVLDEVSYKAIFIGMPFLTIMLVTGSVWAEYAWGRFWSWDPKETWALITWLIYALYLHVRFMKGWKGQKTAWISLLGFAAVLFTYIGVSYLLPGLHSYM